MLRLKSSLDTSSITQWSFGPLLSHNFEVILVPFLVHFWMFFGWINETKLELKDHCASVEDEGLENDIWKKIPRYPLTKEWPQPMQLPSPEANRYF